MNVMSRAGARAWMTALLEGVFSEEEMRSALLALNERPVMAEELAGFSEAMRAASVVLPFTAEERAELVDTCGTGGDTSGTFNISTAVALTAAACGVKVAKHGNRSVTSQCGSADVLEALGIPVGMEADEAVRAIREHGFAFLMAPKMHPAMKVVAGVRRSIGVRTVFNVLGPMTNPAGAAAQVMGVYSARLVPLVAEALALLEVRHAMVVHGETGLGNREQGVASSELGVVDGVGSRGLDELSLSGVSDVAVATDCHVARMTITPEDAGLSRAPLSALLGGGVEENATILHSIFAGEKGPRRDVVLLNAAAVLMVAGAATDLKSGVEQAAEAIDAGAVTRLVSALAKR